MSITPAPQVEMVSELPEYSTPDSAIAQAFDEMMDTNFGTATASEVLARIYERAKELAAEMAGLNDGSLTYLEQRKVIEHMTTELHAAKQLIDSSLQRAEALDCQPVAYAQAALVNWFRENQAALNARAGGDGWLPIESAPKDGTNVLLVHVSEDGPCNVTHGYWLDAEDDGVDYMGADGGFVDVHYSVFYRGRSFGQPAYQGTGHQPTHWQPLPAPPAALASQAVGVKS